MSAPALAGSHPPYGEASFEAGRSPLSALRAMLALWWLATKRNGGFLMLPLVAVAVCWLVPWAHDFDYMSRGVSVRLWMPTVQGVSYSLIVAGPLTAAIASWTAGRSRRRGMADLLATAPLPSGWSTVADWLGVTAWALITYLGCAAAALAWTATAPTWGTPLLWPIVVGAAALAVCAAGGLLLGHLWPSRFLPPLLAVAVGFLIVGPTGIDQLGRLKMLSPLGPIDSVVRESLMQVDTRVMEPHLLWLGALGLALISALIVRLGGGWATRALLVLSVFAAVITAGPLLDYRDREWGSPGWKALPNEPVCTTATVTVCVHPVFEEHLDVVAAEVDVITAPLAGLAMPLRFEQSVDGEQRAGTVRMQFWDIRQLPYDIGYGVPHDLVVDWAAMEANAGPEGPIPTAAQVIVESWLKQAYQQRRGLPDDLFFPEMSYLPEPPAPRESPVAASAVREGERFAHCSETAMTCHYNYAAAADLQARIDAAFNRFVALDPAARTAWLAANWTELRAGLLTLEDMP